MLQHPNVQETGDSIDCVLIRAHDDSLQGAYISISRLSSVLNYILIMVVMVFSLLANQTVHAQSSLAPDKLAAVLTLINMYLLDDEVKLVELNFSQIETQTHTIRDDFEVTFPLMDEDVEFCFVLSRPDPDILFTLNDGSSVSLVEGENCFVIALEDQLEVNSVKFFFLDGSGSARISLIGIASNSPSARTLSSLKRSGWNEVAVRKVLKVFAFGGHATDAQIKLWSNMQPNDAIKEMLNFDQHNLKLSPLAAGEAYNDSANNSLDLGTLRGFQNHISDTSSNIPIPVDSRDQYGIDGYNFDDAFNRMITVRGMNPFRQRIGFWETNYHLAVNLDAGVSRNQMTEYYDQIMEAHEAELPYYQVMGVAAKSAAAAMQYQHRNNRWDDSSGECECNDDFAREIHQLYFGIFGEGDPNHENITIPETAKMLTGMPVPYIQDFGFALEVDFQEGLIEEDHHLAPVDIFETLYGSNLISGADAAAKIDNLMPYSMQHPESLQNLPIMIISVLADDNLNESRKNQLRTSWASMGVNRNFLEFIQAYAISDLFHGPNQFKYFTSHERALYMANKNNLENLEAYFGGAYYDGGRAGRSVGGVISDDSAGDFFRPLHNVFGGQTSTEASDSALAFERNYNKLTQEEYRMRDSVQCDACDLGNPWSKRWPEVLPSRSDGLYYVADIADWLWMHAVGNFDNYTELERAHLYSLLGAARISPGNSWDNDHVFDFNLLMCVIEDYQANGGTDISIANIMSSSVWDDFCVDDNDVYSQSEIDALNRVYTGQDILNDLQIQSILTDLGNVTLPFNTTTGENGGADLREHARERVNNALGFIFTTPFVFAEGQL